MVLVSDLYGTVGEHRVVFSSHTHTGTHTALLTLRRTSVIFFPKCFWRFTKLEQLFLWRVQEGGKVPGVTLQSGSGLNVDLMEPANFSSAEMGISEVLGTRGAAVGSTSSPHCRSDTCNSTPGVVLEVDFAESAQPRVPRLESSPWERGGWASLQDTSSLHDRCFRAW